MSCQWGFITLLLSILPLIVASEVLDCNSLWPIGLMDDEELLDCVPVPDFGYPRAIANTGISVFRFDGDEFPPDNSSRKLSADLDQILDAIRYGAERAINTFGAFDNVIMPKDLVFNMVRSTLPFPVQSPMDTLFLWKAFGKRLPCGIKLHFPDYTRYYDTPEKQAQTVAHEIYHCLQFEEIDPYGFSDIADGPACWWLEGSAEYMSNVVFPSTNLEWNEQATYDFNKALHRQESNYAAGVFWQALETEMGLTPSEIHSMIMKQTLVLDGAQEQKRMSHLPGMHKQFTTFMEVATRGRVRDTNGDYYVPFQPPEYSPSFDIKASGREPRSVRIPVAGFKGTFWQHRIEPGQTVTFGFDLSTINTNTRMFYRSASRPALEQWTEIDQDPNLTLPVRKPCADETETYLFMALSTDPEPQVSVPFTASQLSAEKCNGSTRTAHRWRGGVESRVPAA